LIETAESIKFRCLITILHHLIVYGTGNGSLMVLQQWLIIINYYLSEKTHSKNIHPNFTVKRTFTMRNTGQLPLYVHGFHIGNSPCEGYGFKILDCSELELPPNASHKVDIA